MSRILYVLLSIMPLLGGVAHAADEQAVVTRIVAEQLKVDQAVVDPDAPLSAVGKGANPLDVIEIIMAISRTLNVDIRDATVEAVIGPNTTDELPRKTTVRALTKMVSIAKRKRSGQR
jgi:acyl carrier protein